MIDDPTIGPVTERQRWNDRYRAREAVAGAAGPDSQPEPPKALIRMTALLPDRGRVVDLAGGDGAAALLLARRGLDTTVVDISDVALERAAAVAERSDLSMKTLQFDLADTPLARVLDRLGPSAPVAVTCFNYLDRTLLASVARDLPSGSRFLAAIATTVNLERHDRPSKRFLLEPGELVDLMTSPGSGSAAGRLRVLHRRQGWADHWHRAEMVVEAR